MPAGGMPGIPTDTGTGAGDLDAVFNKSLGEFDGAMEGEREVIAANGGGSAKAASRREQGDADAVANGAGGRPDFDGDGAAGSEGMQGMAGGPGAAGSGSSGQPGTGNLPGAGEPGAAGSIGKAGQPGSGAGEESASEGKPAVKLPDDIPVDGSGDDVVGRQIREAAISMQESNPEAAAKLWDEYRKHTGIK